jgi:sterol desaturase/sphingolipid hydroxylase (fatty acid hydroxylase superfamily)
MSYYSAARDFHAAALDSFWLHAQHHSYTNDAPRRSHASHGAPEIRWQGFT